MRTDGIGKGRKDECRMINIYLMMTLPSHRVSLSHGQVLLKSGPVGSGARPNLASGQYIFVS